MLFMIAHLLALPLLHKNETVCLLTTLRNFYVECTKFALSYVTALIFDKKYHKDKVEYLCQLDCTAFSKGFLICYNSIKTAR